jgi:hypothetical protein
MITPTTPKKPKSRACGRTEGSQQRVVKPPASMLKDHIRKDGTIDDTVVETYYEPLQNVIQVPKKEYIRLQCDAGAVDSETRIAYITLEALGWTRPKPQKEKAA